MQSVIEWLQMRNEWEHTSLCDANKWDMKWKSTHVYVMQSVIEWLQKKYEWEHTGLCDASKWDMKWKANYESNVNDGTHVYVMQRNVWYKKVQVKSDWEAHMSMWCKEKWYEIWYVWKCKWEMDEKLTCLGDTMKCDMKDVMWTDKSILGNMHEIWCISGYKWQKWMRNTCLCVAKFDNGMV